MPPTSRLTAAGSLRAHAAYLADLLHLWRVLAREVTDQEELQEIVRDLGERVTVLLADLISSGLWKSQPPPE